MDRPATLTHARLRIAQGDFKGARRILRRVLERHPGQAEAAALLGSLQARAQRPLAPQREPQPDAPRAATAAELADRFREALRPTRRDPRVVRLQEWLRKIHGPGGERTRGTACPPGGEER